MKITHFMSFFFAAKDGLVFVAEITKSSFILFLSNTISLSRSRSVRVVTLYVMQM